MALRQPNPVLSRSFKDENQKTPYAPMSEDQSGDTSGSVERTMTMDGTVTKTAMLLVILGAAAAFPYLGPVGVTAAMMSLYLPIALATVGIAFAVAFKPHLARQLSIVYAVLEGLLLGTISRILEASYPGIASQALMLTVGVAGGMLFLYRAKIVKVTQNFRIAVISATIGVFLVYVAAFIGRLLGFEVPLLHENTGAGILVSLLIVGIAAANLALDFDFVEHGVAAKMPANYEWVASFGLIVTLAWLYFEILRLLAKLRSRD